MTRYSRNGTAMVSEWTPRTADDPSIDRPSMDSIVASIRDSNGPSVRRPIVPRPNYWRPQQIDSDVDTQVNDASLHSATNPQTISRRSLHVSDRCSISRHVVCLYPVAVLGQYATALSPVHTTSNNVEATLSNATS